MIRTWGGLQVLSQGDVGLRTLSRLLCDSKVPFSVQDSVLNLFAEALEPVVSRTNPYSRPDKLYGIKKLSARHLHGSSVLSPGVPKQRDLSRDATIYRVRSNSSGEKGDPAVVDLGKGIVGRVRGLSIDDDDDDGKSIISIHLFILFTYFIYLTL